jgi:hypothetical protein
VRAIAAWAEKPDRSVYALAKAMPYRFDIAHETSLEKT